MTLSVFAVLAMEDYLFTINIPLMEAGKVIVYFACFTGSKKMQYSTP